MSEDTRICKVEFQEPTGGQKIINKKNAEGDSEQTQGKGGTWGKKELIPGFYHPNESGQGKLR